MKKRVLVGIFLAVAIIFILGSFVSAANELSGLGNNLKQWSSGLFSSQNGEPNYNLYRFFFGIIIFLLITVSLGFIPAFKQKTAITAIIGGIIAIIAAMNFINDEIIALTTQYTALGLTITALLPVLILAGLTYNAVRQNDVTLSLLSQIAWLFYGVFGIYRFLLIIAPQFAKDGWGAVSGWFNIGFLLLSVILPVLMFIVNKQVNAWLYKTLFSKDVQALEDRMSGAEASLKALDDFRKSQTSSS